MHKHLVFFVLLSFFLFFVFSLSVFRELMCCLSNPVGYDFHFSFHIYLSSFINPFSQFIAYFKVFFINLLIASFDSVFTLSYNMCVTSR